MSRHKIKPYGAKADELKDDADALRTAVNPIASPFVVRNDSRGSKNSSDSRKLNDFVKGCLNASKAAFIVLRYLYLDRLSVTHVESCLNASQVVSLHCSPNIFMSRVA